MKIKQLFKGIKVVKQSEDVENISISGIASDSRKVKKGFLFVAMVGPEGDGHRYIPEAVAQGAAVVVLDNKTYLGSRVFPYAVVRDSKEALNVLADNFFGSPYQKINAVGITGTNGKTTTSYLVRSILEAGKKKCGLIGTIGYSVAGENRPLGNTTPGVIDLHQMFSAMVEAGDKYVAMEVSSHALDQERIGRLIFKAAIFTNLTQDHLDYHKTMDKYFESKKKLFVRYVDKCSSLIINQDDAFGQKLARSLKGKVLTYGFSPGSDIQGLEYHLTQRGSSLSVKTAQGIFNLTTPLVGRHNLYNILAAVGFGVSEGLKLSIIKKGVEALEVVRGRLERIDSAQGYSVFIDYAHTDDALKNVLESLRLIPHNGRIITVFGCGGDRDRGKRPKMGRVATSLSDYCIITSDNPRSEEPQDIIREIVAGIDKKNFKIEGNRGRAIQAALDMAKCGDFVLIAGKGHETYQIIKDRTLSFDDKALVLKILKGKKKDV